MDKVHTSNAIDSGVTIGHVHLKVANIERSLAFYCGVLGFELMQRYGSEAAFVSAGGYHHHVGLNTWYSKDGSPPQRSTTGLFHIAIRYPNRAALADALHQALPDTFHQSLVDKRGMLCVVMCSHKVEALVLV